MPRKRYTPEMSARLIVRLLSATDGSRRRLLSELLDVQLAEIAIASSARDDLEKATDEEVATTLRFVQKWLQVVCRTSLVIHSVLQARGIKLAVGSTAGPDEASGPLSSLLAYQVARLARSGKDLVAPCDCGEFFVREGKRKFCSERCQKRVYMRAKRAEEKEGP